MSYIFSKNTHKQYSEIEQFSSQSHMQHVPDKSLFSIKNEADLEEIKKVPVIKNENNFQFFPVTDQKNSSFINNQTSSQNQFSDELIQEKELELPSCSSKNSCRSKRKSDICDPSFKNKKKFKDEWKFYEINFQNNYDYKNESSVDKKLDSDTKIKILKKIKKEDLDMSYEQEFLEKKTNCFGIASFYQQKMSHLLSLSSHPSDTPSISHGIYDYKRVQILNSPMSRVCKKIEMEISNNQMIDFDKSLNIKNSRRYASKNKIRRDFQVAIGKEINCWLKEEAFSQFIDLSLGKQNYGYSDYFSWKKMISEKLSKISSHIKEIILGGKLKKELGNIKGGGSFDEFQLSTYEKSIIRQIMRHSLFSIFIEVDGKSKNIFVPRASMSFFLNKYSDFFLNKFINHFPSEEIFKKIRSRYHFWKKSNDPYIKNVIEKTREEFSSLFEEDYKKIQKDILILDSSRFRPLKNDEFLGLIAFIKDIIYFEGNCGITERALRHFYRDNYLKRYVPKKTCKSPQKYKQEDSFSLTGQQADLKEEKINKNINPREKGGNCFNLAEIYRQLIDNFLQKIGKSFDSQISRGIYDYKRIQYGTTRVSKDTETIEIELTDRHFSSIDSSLPEDFLPIYKFSKNINRKKFQKKLKSRIDEILREPLFLHFIEISLPSDPQERGRTYSYWKDLVSKKIYHLSESIANDFFGDVSKRRKKINTFLKVYSSLSTKSLIRQILRHALFSIPTKNGDTFFISRAGISNFFNKYSDYFLNLLIEHEKIDKNFMKKAFLSCIFWKKSKMKEINNLVNSSQASFIKMIENDQPKIQKEVLVFEKDAFRPMKDHELQELISTIHQFLKIDVPASFLHRAIHHFYREKIHLNKGSAKK